MNRTLPIVLVVLAAACGGQRDQAGFVTDPGDAAADRIDAAIDDGSIVTLPDVGPVDAAISKRFFILVTETPAGSIQQNTWGGVIRYDVADNFEPAKLSTAIPKTDVADPVGLVFRQTSAEVLVGNRRGNTTGSISRFLYDAKTETFTKNGADLMMNDPGGVVQLALSKDEKEVFAARDSVGKITRLTFDGSGNLTQTGAITGLGSMLGVAVSKDGKRLYATQQFSAKVREFDLPSGTELAGFTIPGATRPHLMVLDKKNPVLYVSDVQSNVIYALAIDSNNDLTLKQSIVALNPISVALSPDSGELFSTSHNFNPPDVIERYKPVSGDWVTQGPTTTISTTTALGGTLVFSAAAVPTPVN